MGLITVTALLLAVQDQQLGARTKAMGGSYTAFEDDPVSVWLNPAGIATQPSAMSISYQSYTTYPIGEETTSGGVRTTADAQTTLVDPAFIPSYLGLVFQIGSVESPLAIGVCYARPYHLSYTMDSAEDPNQTVFEPDTNIEQSFSRFRACFAKDFRIRGVGEPGFFTHVSFGGAIDIGYERWSVKGAVTREDNATSPGWGIGVLVGLYDNGENVKINFGSAYQSAVNWHFNTEPKIIPAFDMPQQLNVGLTGYFLAELRLRTTIALQWVEWSETAEDPAFPGQPGFEDALNFSIGFEYRISVSERTSVYPRLGFRRFNAPWDDPDDLPMTSTYKLVLETDDSSFNIGTAGFGISTTDANGRVWVVDIGIDFGGDSFNMALGFTVEI